MDLRAPRRRKLIAAFNQASQKTHWSTRPLTWGPDIAYPKWVSSQLEV